MNEFVVQVICKSKNDFPLQGEQFKFRDKIYPVKKSRISLKMRKMYFVDVVLLGNVTK
jgi:hypothetical protein